MGLFHVPSDAFIKTRMADYGDPEDPDYIPNANDIVSSYNGLLEANTSPGDLDSFVSSDWNEGVIMGFVNTMDPVKTHQTVIDIQKFIREHKDDPGFEKIKIGFKIGDTVHMPETNTSVTLKGDANISDPAVGGFLGATEATREVATTEWLKSPLQTALAIFLIAAIMFRSVVVSGILVVMLGITLFAQYGLGGYFTRMENWSGNLHFATLVSLSIAMGLGVDYGIYMISRLREEMQATAQNWEQALRNTLTSTGSAVFSSVIVLLGSFVPLLGTELANTWALGVFISEALVIDVFTALTILPLMIYWLKPKYVFEKR
jgi:predicted RND superfamily exporter protein